MDVTAAVHVLTLVPWAAQEQRETLFVLIHPTCQYKYSYVTQVSMDVITTVPLLALAHLTEEEQITLNLFMSVLPKESRQVQELCYHEHCYV